MIKIIKHTNCKHVNEDGELGKSRIRYFAVTKEELMSNGSYMHTGHNISKTKALAMGLPIETDDLETITQ